MSFSVLASSSHYNASLNCLGSRQLRIPFVRNQSYRSPFCRAAHQRQRSQRGTDSTTSGCIPSLPCCILNEGRFLCPWLIQTPRGSVVFCSSPAAQPLPL